MCKKRERRGTETTDDKRHILKTYACISTVVLSAEEQGEKHDISGGMKPCHWGTGYQSMPSRTGNVRSTVCLVSRPDSSSMYGTRPWARRYSRTADSTAARGRALRDRGQQYYPQFRVVDREGAARWREARGLVSSSRAER
jgi:hypothetical protein